MKLSDFRPDVGSFSLFVGESGSGKTCAIASYGKLGKVLILDFDRRVRGIYGLRSVLGDDVINNIEVEQYDILNSFAVVDNRLQQLEPLAKAGKCPYQTIVIESVNAMETCFMNMVDAMAQMQKGTGINPQSLGGIRIYGPAHYKFAATAFRQLRDFRLLNFKGVNVILSCWIVNKWGKPTTFDERKGVEVTQQYADNVVVGKKLLLTDKMAEEVPGCFDEVYEFYKAETGLTSRPVKHGVRFSSSIAKTANEALKKAVDIDLTNKLFIDEFNRLTGKETQNA
jgi:hypothetical protein